MPNGDGQHEEIQDAEIEIDKQFTEGRDLIEREHFSSSFTCFNAVLKERYDYFTTKNPGLIVPIMEGMEPKLAGVFLKPKLGDRRPDRERREYSGIPNPYYDKCVALFEQTGNQHVLALIQLYKESRQTEMDKMEDEKKRKPEGSYFNNFKNSYNRFTEAIQRRNRVDYNLFSFLHQRCRNHLAHNNKRISDARNSQIVKHMALLMMGYAEILKSSPKPQ